MLSLGCLKRFKVTLLVILFAVLICAVGAYTVHADHRADRNNFVQWYFGVNDVRLLPTCLKTNSYHYYWVHALSNQSVWVRWEFAHRVRDGWVLGAGGESINISIDGNINTLNHQHHTTSDSGYRRASYADLDPGLYHIEAYTLLDISVTGEGSAVNERAVEYHKFQLTGEEEPN